jgi:arginine N-succinyltransferase
MHLIRPVERDDLPALLELAQHTAFGLTTLPKDQALLERRIRQSLRAFATEADEPPAGEAYLLVMEDLADRHLIGTAGAVSKVGGFDPFFSYQLRTSVHESKSLGVRKEIRTLNLVQEHDGPSEIGSLFLDPAARQPGLGRALSLSRFLLMAQMPQRFENMVIAEMRGVIDERGQSAFWDALGRHFFDLDLPTADYLSVVNKKFIAELMPEYPIYVPLLPAQAQAVIGQVHDHTAPALRILEAEGFEHTDMVDIFEAGPLVQCRREAIRAVRDSRVSMVCDISDDPIDGPTHLVATTTRPFRAAAAPVRVDDAGLTLGRDTAEALAVQAGDPVRHVALRPVA